MSGYLCGSVPYGKLVAARYGIDIQRRGSGNIGFANVRRILGWKAGLITLSADVAKGLLPTLAATHLFGPTAAFTVGLAAIAGHVYPPWLRFRGGKGIATGLGVVLALEPIAGLVGATVYVVCCRLDRPSSTGSLAGLGATALAGMLLSPPAWWQYVILTLVALWTLRANLTGRAPNYDA